MEISRQVQCDSGVEADTKMSVKYKDQYAAVTKREIRRTLYVPLSLLS